MPHPLPSAQFTMAQLLPDIFEPYDPASLDQWLTNDSWPRRPFKPLKLRPKNHFHLTILLSWEETKSKCLVGDIFSVMQLNRRESCSAVEENKDKRKTIFFFWGGGFLDQSILLPHSWGPAAILPWGGEKLWFLHNQLLSLLFPLFSLSWFLLKVKACWLIHCISNDW